MPACLKYSKINSCFPLVLLVPDYEYEMRVGTATVNVIVSYICICSRILQEFDTAIILNQRSIKKIEIAIKPVVCYYKFLKISIRNFPNSDISWLKIGVKTVIIATQSAGFDLLLPEF